MNKLTSLGYQQIRPKVYEYSINLGNYQAVKQVDFTGLTIKMSMFIIKDGKRVPLHHVTFTKDELDAILEMAGGDD